MLLTPSTVSSVPEAAVSNSNTRPICNGLGRKCRSTQIIAKHHNPHVRTPPTMAAGMTSFSGFSVIHSKIKRVQSL